MSPPHSEGATTAHEAVTHDIASFDPNGPPPRTPSDARKNRTSPAVTFAASPSAVRIGSLPMNPPRVITSSPKLMMIGSATPALGTPTR